MLILALDACADTIGVALLYEDKILGSFLAPAGKNSAEILLKAVDHILIKNSLSVKNIDLFAVCNGPGSFTGIRVAVSTIKGLAFASNKPCVTLSALHVLAYPVSHSNFQGYICPVIDARRDHVYTALFRCVDKNLERLTEDLLLPIMELQKFKDVFSTGESKILLIGNASDRATTILSSPFISNSAFQNEISPEYIAYIAKDLFHTCPEDFDLDSTISPRYLRPTQAERERMENEKKEYK